MLQDLTLAVSRRSGFGPLGENGSGKTTFATWQLARRSLLAR
jgi:ABC-type multidrug transport system ATPase subunit